jgi:hypothetical protein
MQASVLCRSDASAGQAHCRSANAASSSHATPRAPPAHTPLRSQQAGARPAKRGRAVAAAVAECLTASAAAEPLVLDVDRANQHVREGHYEAELVQLQARHWQHR